MDGQTPGKRLHRLRVVREGGYSVTFGTSAVRNLIRIVDMQPVFLYLVGMISVLVTRRGRRLGDIVAGTIVVREDARERRARRRECASQGDAGAGGRAAHAAQRGRVRGARPVRASAGRRSTALQRAALAQQLAARFGRRAAATTAAPTGPRLLELYERERARARRRRGRRAARRARAASARRSSRRGARAGTPSRRASPQAQRRGLRSLGEDGVREFVAEYRALVGGSRAAAHRVGRPRARRAVLARPARRRRAQPPVPRPRHAAPRRGRATSSPTARARSGARRGRSRSPRCCCSARRSIAAVSRGAARRRSRRRCCPPACSSAPRTACSARRRARATSTIRSCSAP